METHFIPRTIIPTRIIDRAGDDVGLWKITKLAPDYIIKGYEITIENGKLIKVTFDAKHPNRDPDTSEYCIPEVLKRTVAGVEIIPQLELCMRTYQLENCYFLPWNDIECKEGSRGYR